MAVLSVKRDHEALVDEMEPTAEQYEAIMDPLLKPVVEALQQGGYEFAQEKIATLYAQLDDGELESMMTKAIFISDLLGRCDAK